MAVHMVIIMLLRLLSLSFDGYNGYVVQFGSSIFVLSLRRRQCVFVWPGAWHYASESGAFRALYLC